MPKVHILSTARTVGINAGCCHAGHFGNHIDTLVYEATKTKNDELNRTSNVCLQGTSLSVGP